MKDALAQVKKNDYLYSISIPINSLGDKKVLLEELSIKKL